MRRETDVATRFARGNRVLWRRLPDRLILLHRDHADLVEVSGAGSLLWELFAAPATVEEAAAALADVLAMPPAYVREQIEPVVTELVRRGLVTGQEPG
jgi:hypothetical protein